MDDNDCDGVRSWEDCDDNDPNNTNSNMDDNDCDGVRSWEDLMISPNNTNITPWEDMIMIKQYQFNMDDY